MFRKFYTTKPFSTLIFRKCANYTFFAVFFYKQNAASLQEISRNTFDFFLCEILTLLLTLA